MRFIAPALLVCAAATAQSAAAQDAKPEGATESVQSEPEAKEEKKEEKLRCRRVQEMGSRKTERICLTKEGWREYNNPRR